jgi:hypothetical protein
MVRVPVLPVSQPLVTKPLGMNMGSIEWCDVLVFGKCQDIKRKHLARVANGFLGLCTRNYSKNIYNHLNPALSSPGRRSYSIICRTF